MTGPTSAAPRSGSVFIERIMIHTAIRRRLAGPSVRAIMRLARSASRAASSALRSRPAASSIPTVEGSLAVEPPLAVTMDVQCVSGLGSDDAENAARSDADRACPSESPLDLCDTAAIEEATRVSRDELLWPPQSEADIADGLGAARFLIDLLRSRPDLRLRFPRALTGGSHGDFAEWLAGEGRESLGLTDGAVDSHPRRPGRRHLADRCANICCSATTSVPITRSASRQPGGEDFSTGLRTRRYTGGRTGRKRSAPSRCGGFSCAVPRIRRANSSKPISSCRTGSVPTLTA